LLLRVERVVLHLFDLPFQSAAGKFLAVSADGGVAAESTAISEAELFRVSKAGDGFAVLGANRRFLSAAAAGAARCASVSIGKPEILKLEGFDPALATADEGLAMLINSAGAALGVERDGRAGWGSGSGRFELEAVDGKLAFKAPSGKFLAAQPDGSLAWADSASGPALFRVAPLGDGFSLRAMNDRFVSSTSATANEHTAKLPIQICGIDDFIKQLDLGPTKPDEPPAHRVAMTFEEDAQQSEDERMRGLHFGSLLAPPPPATPIVSSGQVLKPGSRLVSVQAVSTMSKLPAPPATPVSVSAIKPQLIKTAHSSAAMHQVTPPPPPEIEVGNYDVVAGEALDIRVLIPLSAAERTDPKATLEMQPEAARLISAVVQGSHLVATLRVLWALGGEYAFKVVVESNGRTTTGKGVIKVKHAKPQPFGLSSVLGSQQSAEVPYTGQLWKKAQFRAYLEPALKEFRLTSAHGTMEAGARVFPFKVCFTPREPRAVVVLLVVVFNESEEYVVEITGAVGGFQGRNWGKRSHGGLAPSASQGDDVAPARGGGQLPSLSPA
jgi:hypothetical protein